MLVDRGVGGHLHQLDRLAAGPLQPAQEAAFPRGQEEDRVAAAAGPTGAADAVDIGLPIKGDVVVDHQADAFHIKAAGGHIGGHQHIHPAIAEALDRALPKVLGHVSVEHRHLVAVLFERFGHREGDRLGAGEDDRAFAALGLQHPLERFELLGRIDHQEPLTDAAPVGGLGADGDLGGIPQVLLGDAADLRRHRGREEHHLALAGELLKHPLHVVDEAHPEHLIGLVEHQGAQLREIERVLAHVIHHPARGAHHDVDATAELLDLLAEIGAAVDRQHLHPPQAGGIGADRLGHLQRQFAGGGEHQHLGVALVEVESGQQGQTEGRGLAGAGLGLPHQVAAEQQFGDGGLLDRRRFAESQGFEALQQGRPQAEGNEAGDGFGGSGDSRYGVGRQVLGVGLSGGDVGESDGRFRRRGGARGGHNAVQGGHGRLGGSLSRDGGVRFDQGIRLRASRQKIALQGRSGIGGTGAGAAFKDLGQWWAWVNPSPQAGSDPMASCRPGHRGWLAEDWLPCP